MTVDAEQRSRLLRTKLVALTRGSRASDGFDAPEGDLATDAVRVGAITAVRLDDTAYTLAETASAGALASAMLWAHRQGATRVVLFADDHPGDLARWAGYFHLGGGPVDVRAVVGAGSESATASPMPAAASAPDAPDALLEQLRDAGLEVVVEHGVVRGELLGLEVARLVVWPSEHGGDDELHLEAGVGRFDRDAVAAAHPDEAPAEALARAVHAVRAHRYQGAPAHPIQMLSRERWLRADLIADPARIGARRLAPISMTTEADGLRDAHPAAAAGVDLDGRPLVVVCSSGVDLALVPLAADTRELVDPEARLVLALPERDHHVATSTLVGLLRRPAELAVVAPGWS